MDECPITGKSCEHKKYIHITEVSPDYTCSKSLNLCHICSSAIVNQEEYEKAVIDDLIQYACKQIKQSQEKLIKNCCPKCNHSIEDIIKISKLGCAECYNHFKKELTPVIDKIHKSIQHKGKIPNNLSSKSKKELKKELKDAIAKEDYNKAIKIRDILNE
jgi:protein arginine kinase activator